MKTKQIKRRDFSDYLLPVGILIGLLFWALYTILDAQLLHRESVLDYLFSPESLQSHLRLVIMGVIILLTGLAQWYLKHMKQAEKILELSGKKFQHFFDNTPLCSQVLDESGRILEVNQPWLDILGYEREEIVGKWFAKFVESKDRKRFKEAYNQFRTSGEIHDAEFRLQRKDGTILVANLDGKVVLDENGFFKQTQSVFRDVTRQREVETAIQDEWRIFAGGPIIAIKFRAEENWPVDYVSLNVWEQFGHMPDDLISGNLKFLSLIHDEDRGRVLAEVETKSLARTPYYEQEYRFLRADGQYRWVYDFTVFLREYDGQVTHYIHYLHDVTERKALVPEPQSTAESFTKIFQTNPAAITITALQDGRILEVNQAFLTLTGYTREEVMGRTTLDLNVWQNPLEREQFLKVIQEQRSLQNLELNLSVKSGELLDILCSLELIDWQNQPCILSMIVDVTYKKRAFEQQCQSLKRFESVFQNTPLVAMQSFDTQGVIRLWNAACTPLYGYDSTEALGRRVQDLILFPEDVPAFEETLRQLAATGLPTPPQEWRVRRRNDEERMVYSTLVPIKPNGKVTEIFCMDVDVTQQLRAETALIASEARLRSIFECAPNIIALTDLQGRITDINFVAPGFTRESTLGTSFFDYLTEDQKPRLQEAMDHVLQTGETSNYEVQITSPLGEITWWHNRLSAIKSSSEITGLVIVCNDITERKQAEDILKSREEKFHKLFQEAPVGYQSLDPQGHIIEVNETWLKTLKYSREQVLGRWFGDFLVDDIQSKFRENFPRFKELGEVHGIEFEMKRGDRSIIIVSFEGKAVKDEAGQYLSSQCLMYDVTERKLGEIALRESETRYRSLIELSPDAIAIHQEGKFVFVNQAAVKLFGAAGPEDLIGMPIFDRIHADYHQVVRERNAALREGRQIASLIEVKFIRLKGSRVEVEVAAVPYTYQGRPAVQVIIRDISQRKQAEEALRLSEEKYRNLADSLPQVVFETDLTGRLTYLNRNALKIFGISEEDIQAGIYATQYLLPEDVPRAKANMQKRLAGEEVSYTEYHMRRKDGSFFPVVTHSDRILQEGKVVGLRGFLVDITERKQAEIALRESEERYRRLVELSPDAIAIHQAGKLVFVNSAAVKLFGATRLEQLLGKSILEVVHPDYHQMIRDRIAAAQAGHQIAPLVEEKFIQLDGTTLDVEVTAVPFTFNNQPAMQVIVRDISQRKRAEEALRQSEAQYRNLADSLPQVVFEMDVNGKLTFVNRNAFNLFRYIPEDFERGLNALDMIIPEERPRALENIAKALKGEALDQVEFTALRRDDTTFSITVHANRILRDHIPVGLRGVIIDITERKLAEEVLESFSNRQNAILGSIPDIIAEVNESKVYTWLNKAGLEFFGEDAIGKEAASFFVGEQETYKAVKPLFSGSEDVIYVESWQRRKDGEKRLLAWWCRVLKDNHGRVTGAISTARDLTEHKQMVTTLQENEAHMRSLFENMLNGFAYCRMIYEQGEPQDFVYLSVNKAFEKQTGLKNVVGKKVSEVIPGIRETDPELFEIYGRVAQTGVPHRFETYMKALEMWFEISVYSPSQDHFVAVFDVITKRKRSEEKLKENEQRLRDITFSSADWVWEVDEKGIYTYSMGKGDDLFGPSSEDIIGKTPFDFMPPDEAERIAAIFSEIVAKKAPIKDLENWNITKNGERVCLLTNGVPILDEEGNLKGYRGVDKDITKRKQAAQVLQENERLLRATLESTADGILVVNEVGQVTHTNERFAQMWRILPELIALKDDKKLLDYVLSQLQAPEAFMAKVVELYQSTREDFDVLDFKDGRCFERFTSPLIREGKPCGRVWSFRDVTERKRAEEALQESEGQLSNAMIMARLGHWQYDVAKDLFTFNDHFYKIFRTTAEQVGGYQMLSAEYARRFVHPDDMAVIRDETQKAIETTDPNFSRQLEHRMLYADGTVGHIAVRFFIIKDAQGRTIKTYGVNQDITERKQAEEELQNLASVVRHSNELVNLATLDGRMTFLNEAGAKMLGIDLDKIDQVNIMEVIPDHLKEKVQTELLPALLSGGTWEGELQYRNLKTDQLTDVHAMTFTVTEPGTRTPLYLANVSLDVTERVQAEKEREALLNVSQLLLGELDAEQALRDLSQQIHSLIPHDLLALGLIQKESDQVDLILAHREAPQDQSGHSEIPEDFFESYQGSLIQQILYDRRPTLQSHLPENSTPFVNLLRQLGMNSYLALPLNKAGIPLGMLFLVSRQPSAFDDRYEPLLTQLQPQLALFVQHQRLIEKLVDSEAKYRALFENSNDPIYILQDKRFVFVNRKFVELLEYQIEELNQPGFDFLRLVAPQSIPLVQDRGRRIAAGEILPPTYEFQGLSKSGKVYDFEVNVTYTNYQGKPAAQGISRDITERKRSEARQHEMQLELMHSAKLSSLGMLAAGVAHNVNVPLQGIINQLELARLTGQDFPQLDDLLNQAQRIGSIINNLLYKSRQEQDTTARDLDLNQLLAQELAFLNADLDFKHNVQKHFQFDPQLPRLPGLYSDFSQALLNLIRNALDAMYQAPVKQLFITTRALPDQQIMIEVRDTGCGIPLENHARIFDPFFTTKPLHEGQEKSVPTGTGLGLSSSLQLLKKYHARFEVESQVGLGTSIKIYLPLESSSVKSPPAFGLARRAAQEVVEEI